MTRYISGRITGLPYPIAVGRFAIAARRLSELGHHPVNPIYNGLPRDATWAEHIRADLATLKACDGVCMLRGWERSRGARIERHTALKRGMPIYTFSEDRRLIPLPDSLDTNPINNHKMKVKIVNTSRHPLPKYATPLSAGVDVHASLEAPVTLEPMQRALIPTGLRIELPAGYEAQVRPRSGLAIKYGLTVLNTPGTIDADYRGEIRVILANLSDTPFTVYDGGRIAQLVVTRCEHVEWQPVDALDETARGCGGFGHTGV